MVLFYHWYTIMLAVVPFIISFKLTILVIRELEE